MVIWKLRSACWISVLTKTGQTTRAPHHCMLLLSRATRLLCSCLLDAGADKERATKKGTTPLHAAAHHGHRAVVQYFLDAGADKEKANSEGSTPLHSAARQGHQAVVQCLLDVGADKEKATNDGCHTIAFCCWAGAPGCRAVFAGCRC
ncbi:unnamed protein product [Effrenium voratum]|nr:unnamed protein product [Effrenium voratum]